MAYTAPTLQIIFAIAIEKVTSVTNVSPATTCSLCWYCEPTALLVKGKEVGSKLDTSAKVMAISEET